MSAIETCRTAALGGHVERCEDCAHERVAYNSCRNRHCPKCQGAAARQWLAEREAELLPVPYYHVVFTLPASISAVAFQNKAVVYDLLFKTAAETLTTIAADPKHLGARVGLTAVLHTWGSALTHHPHVHVVVPGGGLSPDGSRWIACKSGFFLPVRVLSRLFRRLFLEGLAALHKTGRLAFFGDFALLADQRTFDAVLTRARRTEWVVYAKRPFAGPQAVLAYLARYTHRVAISNSRLIAIDQADVTFKWKDYRIKGRDQLRTMTLDAAEFIRRFLLHVLPSGFHRIRHYGLFAGTVRARNIERVRQWLAAPEASPAETDCDFEDPNTGDLRLGAAALLWRSDDHRQNLRRRAPRALAIADPDQDRHLMIIVTLPASLCLSPSPPLARRSRNAMSSRPPQTLSSRCAHTHRSHPRPRKSASCSLLTITPAALHPRRHIGDPSATPKSP